MSTDKPSPLYAALKELVDLKATKVEMEKLEEEGNGCTDAQQMHYNTLLSRYASGKEKAWDAARSLIATAGWVLAKQGPPENGRPILMATGAGELIIGRWDRRLGPHDGSGAYARVRRKRLSSVIEEVHAVVAWAYIQLPPAALFE